MHEIPINNGRENSIKLVTKNGNTKWQCAINSYIEYHQECEIYQDISVSSKVLNGHKKIKVHFVFCAKRNRRHKSRLDDSDNIGDVLLSSMCTSAVSFQRKCLVMILAELNGLKSLVEHLDSKCLKASAKEKVCFIARTYFWELIGHILLINNTLNGLCASGLL